MGCLKSEQRGRKGYCGSGLQGTWEKTGTPLWEGPAGKQWPCSQLQTIRVSKHGMHSTAIRTYSSSNCFWISLSISVAMKFGSLTGNASTNNNAALDRTSEFLAYENTVLFQVQRAQCSQSNTSMVLVQIHFQIKDCFWGAGKMAQRARACDPELGNLSSIPGTHSRENWLQQVVLWPPHILPTTYK